MYIEKLTQEEIKDIFKQLVSILEDNNQNIIDQYLNDFKISNGIGVVPIFFNYEQDGHNLSLTDFNAYVSYGDVDVDKKITIAYRKYMYKKFGNEYYENMRDYYKRDIMKACDKRLEKLSQDLAEMIK